MFRAGGWWDGGRRPPPRPAATVAALSSCGLPHTTCETVDQWLSELELTQDQAESATSSGEVSESESDSMNSSAAARHAELQAAGVAHCTCAHACATFGAADSAASAAREDEREIEEWYEEQRLLGAGASLPRRTLSCAQPLPDRLHTPRRHRAHATG